MGPFPLVRPYPCEKKKKRKNKRMSAIAEESNKRTFDELNQTSKNEPSGNDEKSAGEPVLVDAKVVFGSWKEEDIPSDSVIYLEGKKTTRCFATFKLVPKDGVPTMEGQAEGEYIMSYSRVDPTGMDSVSDSIGILKISGKVMNKSGAFLCQRVGHFENLTAKNTLTILPNTGTEELAGISGSGEWFSAYGGDSYLKLHVTFNSKK
jgi:hypothetical protein